MRDSPWIVPSNDQDVYLVLDDYGEWGTAWRETDVEDTDFESVITDLLEGQYINPVRVVGFNVSQGWVRDASEDVVRELRQRCADQDRSLPDFLQEFVVRHQTAKNLRLALNCSSVSGSNAIGEPANYHRRNARHGRAQRAGLCSDYRCSHSIAISADRRPDHVRLSERSRAPISGPTSIRRRKQLLVPELTLHRRHQA
jgi:hypothetical protein